MGLLLAAAIYYREELHNLQGYGYIGVFIVGVLCGISIIPAPTLVMVFFMGGTLHPAFVGLAAGLGGAIGGITVYLTGAGVESMWSRWRQRGKDYESGTNGHYDPVRPFESRFWSKGEGLYNRVVKLMGGRTGNWTLFITSALIISPFYFAGLAAGSLKIGLLRFFLISWAGKTMRYLQVSYAGYFGLVFLLDWIGG
ncbi:hypothetical protein ACFLVU_03975 [Chloroflexota bacterium]